jgi:phosphoribosyl-dephospho-CoA transferase
MRPEPHTLLRIDGPTALTVDSDVPTWVFPALERAPWVVVRRASCRDGLVPVGVRGDSRDRRFASWVSEDGILERATPRLLASRRAWAVSSRRDLVPALAALDAVSKIMLEHGLEDHWGPGGSVGFELASGRATATANSDLDLVVQSDQAIPFASTRSLLAALAGLSVKTDVLLEMPHGAVALAEYARAESFVLRTAQGPRLIRNAAEL